MIVSDGTEELGSIDLDGIIAPSVTMRIDTNRGLAILLRVMQVIAFL